MPSSAAALLGCGGDPAVPAQLPETLPHPRHQTSRQAGRLAGGQAGNPPLPGVPSVPHAARWPALPTPVHPPAHTAAACAAAEAAGKEHRGRQPAMLRASSRRVARLQSWKWPNVAEGKGGSLPGSGPAAAAGPMPPPPAPSSHLSGWLRQSGTAMPRRSQVAYVLATKPGPGSDMIATRGVGSAASTDASAAASAASARATPPAPTSRGTGGSRSIFAAGTAARTRSACLQQAPACVGGGPAGLCTPIECRKELTYRLGHLPQWPACQQSVGS